MDKRKGYVLLLINAGVMNSVSESKNLGGCSITCNGIPLITLASKRAFRVLLLELIKTYTVIFGMQISHL